MENGDYIDVWRDIAEYLNKKLSPEANGYLHHAMNGKIILLTPEMEQKMNESIADESLKQIIRMYIRLHSQSDISAEAAIKKVFKDGNKSVNTNVEFMNLDEEKFKAISRLKLSELHQNVALPQAVNDDINKYIELKPKYLFFEIAKAILENIETYDETVCTVAQICSVIQSVVAILHEIYDIRLLEAGFIELFSFLFSCEKARESIAHFLRQNEKRHMPPAGFKSLVLSRCSSSQETAAETLLKEKKKIANLPVHLHYKDHFYWLWYWAEDSSVPDNFDEFDCSALVSNANDTIRDPKSFKDDFNKGIKRVTYYKPDITQFVVCECDDVGEPTSILYIGGNVFEESPTPTQLLNTYLTEVTFSVKNLYCALRNIAKEKNSVAFNDQDVSRFEHFRNKNDIGEKLRLATISKGRESSIKMKNVEAVVHHVTKHRRVLFNREEITKRGKGRKKGKLRIVKPPKTLTIKCEKDGSMTLTTFQ